MHLPLLFFDLHFPGNLISYALVLNYLPNHFLPKQVSIKNNQYRITKTQNYKGPLGQSLQYLWLSLHKLTNSISTPPGYDGYPSRGYTQHAVLQHPFLNLRGARYCDSVTPEPDRVKEARGVEP